MSKLKLKIVKSMHSFPRGEYEECASYDANIRLHRLGINWFVSTRDKHGFISNPKLMSMDIADDKAMSKKLGRRTDRYFKTVEGHNA